jgi:uncharacterized protein (DUF2141 family)
MRVLSIVLILFSQLVFAQTKTGTLTIEVKKYKKAQGNILISVYKTAEGFPTKPEKAFKKFIVPIKGNTFEYSIPELPEGTYAVGIIHDENADNQMESNFIGIPKEGIGTSNDAKGNFGPPKFDDAKFSFAGGTKKIIINLVYL